MWMNKIEVTEVTQEPDLPELDHCQGCKGFEVSRVSHVVHTSIDLTQWYYITATETNLSLVITFYDLLSQALLSIVCQLNGQQWHNRLDSLQIINDLSG